MSATLQADQIKDKAEVRKLLPTEKDFIGRPGYERKYTGGVDCDGKPRYKWRFRYRPNVDGKWTKTGGEVLERMRPFMKADTERHQKLEAQKERARLKDSNGSVHYVDPSLADKAARRNGWRHPISGKRSQVERGPDGMAFKLVSGEWQPTGKWCLSTPWTQHRRPKGGRKDGTMICSGSQRAPDGTAWRGLGKEGWVRL